MRESEREPQRQAFLTNAGWTGAQLSALQPDASFRRYFRVCSDGSTAMLMDAPPQRESVVPFVQVATHLLALGLSAPRVFAHDDRAGFVLLEDFGDDTFTRLLAAGVDERALYRSAVDVLTALHSHPQALEIDVPPSAVTVSGAG